MVTDTSPNEFRTSDTPVAAYLLSEGYKLLEIDYTDPRAVLIFNDDAQDIKEKVRLFYLADAQGNVAVFFHKYKQLSRMIRNQLPA